MKYFLVLCLGWSIFLRFWQLNQTPSGFDMDEAQIVLTAKESIAAGKFYLYSPHSTYWEMLAGYFFALVEFFKRDLLRYFASIMSFLEIFMLFLIVRKNFSRPTALYAATFLALMPWHIFYARILGTCNGVVLFALIAIYWINGPWWKVIGIHLLGLAYYTTYRLVVLQILVSGLVQKKWKQVLWIGIAIGCFFLMAWFSSSPFKYIFARGSYNFTQISNWWHYGANYLYCLIAPFVFPLPYYQHLNSNFIVDYVHSAMMASIPYDTPLSWAGSGLILVGIIVYGKTLWRHRQDSRLQFFLSTGLLIFGVLGFMGPSMGRLTLLMPLFAIAGGYLLLRLPHFLVVAILIMMGHSSFQMIKKLQNPVLMEPFFHSRLLKIDEFIQKQLSLEKQVKIYVILDRGFKTMKYLQSRSKISYQVFPLVDHNFFARAITNDARPGQKQWIIFDQHPNILISDSSKNQREKLQKTLEYLQFNPVQITSLSQFALVYQGPDE